MPDPLALDSESLDPGLLVQAARSIRPGVRTMGDPFFSLFTPALQHGLDVSLWLSL
jgi:hypothetical protein